MLRSLLPPLLLDDGGSVLMKGMEEEVEGGGGGGKSDGCEEVGRRLRVAVGLVWGGRDVGGSLAALAPLSPSRLALQLWPPGLASVCQSYASSS